MTVFSGHIILNVPLKPCPVACGQNQHVHLNRIIFSFSLFFEMWAPISHTQSQRVEIFTITKKFELRKSGTQINIVNFFLFLTIRWGNRVYFFGKQKIKTIVFLFIWNNLLQQTLVSSSLKDYFLYFETNFLIKNSVDDCSQYYSEFQVHLSICSMN